MSDGLERIQKDATYLNHNSSIYVPGQIEAIKTLIQTSQCMEQVHSGYLPNIQDCSAPDRHSGAYYRYGN